MKVTLTTMDQLFYKRKTLEDTRPPTSSKELDMYLRAVDAPTCFMKKAGGWYKRTRQGTYEWVSRVLYKHTLKEWANIAQNDKFTSNI